MEARWLKRVPGSSWLALLALTIATASCANLAAIREFASTSADSAAYTKLVGEYLESPLRQKRYQPAARHPDLDRIAAERAAQGERLRLWHRLIEEYMEALGQLAADEAVVYDKEINALGKAATEAKFLSAQDADAFSAVTRTLLRLVADGWRRRQISRLIEETNQPFQAVVSALRTVVRQGFGSDAANERAAINKHYSDLVVQSRDQAGIAALKEWQELRISGVEDREKAIGAYGEILDRIAAAHQRLYNGRKDLPAKALLADMKGYSKEIRTLFEVVRDRL